MPNVVNTIFPQIKNTINMFTIHLSIVILLIVSIISFMLPFTELGLGIRSSASGLLVTKYQLIFYGY